MASTALIVVSLFVTIVGAANLVFRRTGSTAGWESVLTALWWVPCSLVAPLAACSGEHRIEAGKTDTLVTQLSPYNTGDYTHQLWWSVRKSRDGSKDAFNQTERAYGRA